MYDFNFSYSLLLKSDPNLDCTQQAHCDQASPYTFGKELPFTFSEIISMKKESFLNIIARSKGQPQHILIRIGNFLFVRNDIPHHGCENINNHTNYCIHILVVPLNLHYKAAAKSVPFHDFGPCPNWFGVPQRCINSFK